MKYSGAKDRIAFQYSHNYSDIFTIGTKRLETAINIKLSPELVITSCYLEFFSTLPDSHISRKYGEAKAIQMRDAAQTLVSMTGLGSGLNTQHDTLLEWDARLKTEGINPGTSADLTVASLLAHKLAA